VRGCECHTGESPRLNLQLGRLWFDRPALESILGVSLSVHFPLSETQPADVVIPGFSKALNGRIAKEMDLHDLSGSDLGEVTEEVIRRATF